MFITGHHTVNTIKGVLGEISMVWAEGQSSQKCTSSGSERIDRWVGYGRVKSSWKYFVHKGHLSKKKGLPFNAWSIYKTFCQGIISNTLTRWHGKGMNDVLPTHSWTIVCLFWVFFLVKTIYVHIFQFFSILFFSCSVSRVVKLPEVGLVYLFFLSIRTMNIFCLTL